MRQFDRGNSVKLYNEYYLPCDENGKIKCFLNHTPCLVIKTFSNETYVSVDGITYELIRIEKNERISPNFDEK